ncbi:hypothetical protein CHK_2488 [Christensenella hongkongensis]|uniref:Uncharacterized protein n=1 Tax=Christensenella hongkongensis TaxID=270498 RepID=A0A0M2NJK0_9FIRM|nr:hypothetical protein CHK_2488 [Christensenella hongkongensis]
MFCSHCNKYSDIEKLTFLRFYSKKFLLLAVHFKKQQSRPYLRGQLCCKIEIISL